MPHCPLHAQQNCVSKTSLLSSFVTFFSRRETWWISLRCSTWSLHLWFRKPLTEAKDSLCGVGGNVDLCGPGNPHKRWLALTPSFPPHPSFLLSHVASFLSCPHFFFFISFSLSLRHTLLCSSLSKQHVCREFRRMHLVTQMSHTSSGLHASPSGWMNERAERLAGGGAQWLKRDLCQLLSGIKKVSACWSHGLRRAYQRQLKMWLFLGGCVTALTRLSHRFQLFGNLRPASDPTS